MDNLLENLSCFYVDHNFYDTYHIGQIYTNQLKNINNSNQTEFALLATCQRIELYTTRENNILSFLNLPFRRISGYSQIIHRLISIASGLHSQILGERNIYYQMQEVKNNLHDQNYLKKIFSSALNYASHYRESYSFKANKDYEDIALDIIKQNLSEEFNSIDLHLIVIGGGMLAQELLRRNHNSNNFSNIHIITRSPKKFRKKITDKAFKNVFKICNFIKNIPENYCIVVATKEFDEEYKRQVYPLLTSLNCKGIFELSAAPTFDNSYDIKAPYHNTYKSNYLEYVNMLNALIIKQYQTIKRIIDSNHLLSV